MLRSVPCHQTRSCFEWAVGPFRHHLFLIDRVCTAVNNNTSFLTRADLKKIRKSRNSEVQNKETRWVENWRLQPWLQQSAASWRQMRAFLQMGRSVAQFMPVSCDMKYMQSCSEAESTVNW